MSMLDSFFKQRFNAAKCKTLLKLTIPRIKLLRNRREIQIKQMRKDIAKLLETGQEATARIRVEHIIREEKMMAAQEIVELFCELIAVRLPIIESQRECPLDLKEAISSVCFAAPRCADLPELLHVQMLFAGKYGKEFVSAATELMPECGVNRQLVELLSVRAPSPDVKLNLLKEIAEEHELDWDPSATESELLKPHEDLLNGSTQFVSLSVPEVKHHENATSEHATTHENSDSSGMDSDILDFPEVPKQPIQQTNKVVTVSEPEMLHFPASALSDVDDDQEQDGNSNNNTSHLETEDVVVAKEDDASPSTISQDKQFVPFISPPPSQSSPSFPVREQESPPSISNTKNDNNNNYSNNYSINKNNSNVDLQDVLAAALAAAESAERAASAARSAATIAQLRISELFNKNNDQLDKQPSIGNSDNACPSQSQPTSYDPQLGVDPYVVGPTTGLHQPQRLPSMDDEPYFSYPNLFTPQGSNLSTHQQSFTDSK